jgi:hypothetical protein
MNLLTCGNLIREILSLKPVGKKLGRIANYGAVAIVIYDSIRVQAHAALPQCSNQRRENRKASANARKAKSRKAGDSMQRYASARETAGMGKKRTRKLRS